MIITTILCGMLYGVVISLCFSFGPAFFTLLQTSVEYGFKKAYPIAFGINANDIIVVTLLITLLRTTDVVAVMHKPLVSTIGAVALVAFGIYTMLKKQHDADRQGEAIQRVKSWQVYLKGLTINMFNPMIWIFWATFVSAPTLFGDRLSLSIAPDQMGWLFVGVLMVTLSLDILKCKVASMLQHLFTARRLHIFNLVVGLVLVGFGVYLALLPLLQT